MDEAGGKEGKGREKGYMKRRVKEKKRGGEEVIQKGTIRIPECLHKSNRITRRDRYISD